MKKTNNLTYNTKSHQVTFHLTSLARHMSAYVNSFRIIRLLLKTGYVKKEPAEYRFMLRYPPLGRSGAPPAMDIQPSKIPYYKLYEKIMTENPILRDEKVYPAFWQQEPVALTLAKKQYQFIREGMSEDDALKAAQKFVNDLENISYEEIIKINKMMKDKDATDSIFTDPVVHNEILKWRNVIKDTNYEELSLEDKGEIDYFIQTKLLKWREVERERRMKDPVFVWQFNKLRDQVFPKSKEEFEKNVIQKREEFKRNLIDSFNIDANALETKSPFYYEDYVSLFNKLSDRPILSRWNERHRDNLSRWIIDTLAFKSLTTSASPAKTQKYLDQIRSQFFPMIKFPGDAASFKLPSVDEMKKILYENGIGYKTEDKKLFIKRFYCLPSLLFPQQTWTIQILNDQEKLRSASFLCFLSAYCTYNWFKIRIAFMLIFDIDHVIYQL